MVFYNLLLKFHLKNGQKKEEEEDDTFLSKTKKKETEEKQNSATIMISANMKGTVSTCF